MSFCIKVGANGEKHRRLRRLLAHAFSEKALKAQEIILQGYVDTFISQLHARASVEGDSVVNMVHWFNFTTFDIIGDLAFGESFGLLQLGTWQRYLSSIFGLLEFNAYFRSIRRLFPRSLENFVAKIVLPANFQDDRMYIFNVAETKLASRTSINTERQDFGTSNTHSFRRNTQLQALICSQYITCLKGLKRPLVPTD
jgi:aspirochlorine biosynthesis cytochrome P450 monooxygenase